MGEGDDDSAWGLADGLGGDSALVRPVFDWLVGREGVSGPPRGWRVATVPRSLPLRRLSEILSMTDARTARHCLACEPWH